MALVMLSCVTIGNIKYDTNFPPHLMIFLRLLRSENASYPATAVSVIAFSRFDLEYTMPAIVGALKDEDWWVRKAAVESLGEMRPSPKAYYSKLIVPALLNTLDDESWHVRKGAMELLGKIGPDARDACQKLSERIEKENWHLRLVAVETLGRMGSDSIPYLVETLRHDDHHIRVIAAEILGIKGGKAIEALPTLKAMSESDENESVRKECELAISKISRHEGAHKS